MVHTDIKVEIGGIWINATLYKGTPKGDVPKSYKRIGIFSHNIGNAYNTDIITIYYNTSNEYRYEIYRDGCFFPYYGKIIFECNPFKVQWLKFKEEERNYKL